MLKRKQLKRKNCILPLMADPEYDIDEWLNEKGEENNNIIFIVGTRDMDEITAIICTSATEIEMVMKDRDKCKYACEKNNMGTVQRDTKYIPFVLGMEAGDIGYISREEANSILYLVYAKKGRIFELSFETTIPYTASIAAADDINPNWVSANHCQTGSTILHYTVSYREDKQGILDVIEAQRQRILQIKNYDKILQLCKETDKKLLCDNDPEILEHIQNLKDIKRFSDKNLIIYENMHGALIVQDKITNDQVKIIRSSGGVFFDYKNILITSIDCYIVNKKFRGLSIFKNLNREPIFTKNEPGLKYEYIFNLNHVNGIVTYITYKEHDSNISYYNFTEYKTNTTLSLELKNYVEKSKSSNNLDIIFVYHKVQIFDPEEFKNKPKKCVDIKSKNFILDASCIKISKNEYSTLICTSTSTNYHNIIRYKNNTKKKVLKIPEFVNNVSISNSEEFVYYTKNKIHIANLKTMKDVKEIELCINLPYITCVKKYNDKIVFVTPGKMSVLNENTEEIKDYNVKDAERLFLSNEAIENL